MLSWPVYGDSLKYAPLIFAVVVLLMPFVVAEERIYKGQHEVLLMRNDQLWIGDIAVKLVDADHRYGTAKLRFRINDGGSSYVTLSKGTSTLFQGRLKITVEDVFRRKVYEGSRTEFARVSIEQRAGGSLSAAYDYGRRFSFFVENTGAKPQTYYLSAKAAHQQYDVELYKQAVTLEPFESRRVYGKLTHQGTDSEDTIVVTLSDGNNVVDTVRIPV
ncbi:hypothetical protein J4464_06960 [Candidatus Woesearchaeota archaeon]|nr:hypothetical protein [Candidatus Woesearchaeota archaeon]